MFIWSSEARRSEAADLPLARLGLARSKDRAGPPSASGSVETGCGDHSNLRAIDCQSEARSGRHERLRRTGFVGSHVRSGADGASLLEGSMVRPSAGINSDRRGMEAPCWKLLTW